MTEEFSRLYEGTFRDGGAPGDEGAVVERHTGHLGLHSPFAEGAA